MAIITKMGTDGFIYDGIYNVISLSLNGGLWNHCSDFTSLLFSTSSKFFPSDSKLSVNSRIVSDLDLDTNLLISFILIKWSYRIKTSYYQKIPENKFINSNFKLGVSCCGNHLELRDLDHLRIDSFAPVP